MNWDHMKNYNKKEDIVMSKEVITYINENLWYLVFDRCRISILDAGRIRNG